MRGGVDPDGQSREGAPDPDAGSDARDGGAGAPMAGEVQPAPLPRATRKRLGALRDDLRARLARLDGHATPPVEAAPPAPSTTEARAGGLAAAAGPAIEAQARAALGLLASHRQDGGAAALAQARQSAADALARIGRDAGLPDLAWLGRALLGLHDATTQDRHLEAAERLAAAVRRLEVPRGGFRMARGGDAAQLDLPANAAAARFLVELGWRIGVRGGHRAAAEKAVRRLGAPAALDRCAGDADGLSALAEAVDALLAEPLHATVVGTWEHPDVARLHRACLRLPHDPLVLDLRAAGHDFPDVGAPCVYLVRGSRCASPVKDEAGILATVALLA